MDKRYEAITLDDQWGPGGTYRQVATAFTAAASGNISGATNEFVQAGVVNWLQSIVATGIKQLAENYGIDEGTPAHAALHAVSACVGVKTRLVIYAFRENFRAFFTPLFECLDRRLVLESSLRDIVGECHKFCV